MYGFKGTGRVSGLSFMELNYSDGVYLVSGGLAYLMDSNGVRY
jgi:hypothetical protein